MTGNTKDNKILVMKKTGINLVRTEDEHM
jgi:hypothetical protein